MSNKNLSIKQPAFRWFSDYKSYNKQYVATEKSGLFKRTPTSNNRILTKEVQLSLDFRQTRKNNHVFVASNYREEATNNYILPNVLQANTNYLILDPGGDIYNSTASYLIRQGYTIQTLNLSNPSLSGGYNPFYHFIIEERVKNTDKGYQKFVVGDGLGYSTYTMIDTFLKSTDDYVTPYLLVDKSKQSTLRDAEEYLFMAIAGFVIDTRMLTWTDIAEMLNMIFVDIQNKKIGSPDYTATMDKLFNELLERNPNSQAPNNWAKFKAIAKDDIYQVVLLANMRTQIFRLDTIAEIMTTNTIDVRRLAEPKQAIFIIVPDSDTTFDSIAAMFLQQAADELYGYAEKSSFAALPTHITIIIHDRPYINIPDLPMKLATSRKYNISYNIISHSIQTIKNKYSNCWEIVLDNCDSFLWLRCTEDNMVDYVRIRLNNTYPNKFLKDIPQNKCILFIRGLEPFNCERYNLTQHPNYIDYMNS